MIVSPNHIRIFFAPGSVNALQWSEDNLLALATTSHIHIFVCFFSPSLFYLEIILPVPSIHRSSKRSCCNSAGKSPRTWLSLPFEYVNALVFTEITISIYFICWLDSAYLSVPVHLPSDLNVVSMSWSPTGIGPNGCCLLAVCTSSGSVSVFGPPDGPLSLNWEQVSYFSLYL